MDQIMIGKFIACERKEKLIRRSSFPKSLESVIRRFQNGSAETGFPR